MGDVRESLKLQAVVVVVEEEGVEEVALSLLGEALALWLEVVRLLLLAVHSFLCCG